MFEIGLGVLLLLLVAIAFDGGREFEKYRRVRSRIANDAAAIALGRTERRRARRTSWI